MMSPSDTSTPELVARALSQTSSLVREEVRLARAELAEKATQAAVAIGLLAGAIVVSLVALNVLAAALVAALTEIGVAGGWAAMIVGVSLAIAAFLMARKGVQDLKAKNLALTRTLENVKQDAQAARDAANG